MGVSGHPFSSALLLQGRIMQVGGSQLLRRVSRGRMAGQEGRRGNPTPFSLDGWRRRARSCPHLRGLSGRAFPLLLGSPAVILGSWSRLLICGDRVGERVGQRLAGECPQAVLETFPVAKALRLRRRAPRSDLGRCRCSRGLRRPIAGAACPLAASPGRLRGAGDSESTETCVGGCCCGTCWLLLPLLLSPPPPGLRLRRLPRLRASRGACRSSPCRGGGRWRVAGSLQPLLPQKVPVPPLEHHVLGAVGVLTHCGD